jgi:hypothetical protein
MAALSQREFAKLLGVSHVQVNRAIKRGRVTRGVTADGKIEDPEAARAEYEATLDLTRAAPHVHMQAAQRQGRAPRPGPTSSAADAAPPGGAPPVAVLGGSFNENNAAKVYWQARQAQLDFERESGELIPAREVEAEWTTLLVAVRTRLMGIPTRLKQAVPEMTTGAVAEVEELIREALEELVATEGR